MADTAIDKKTGEYILRDRVSGKLRAFKAEEVGRLVQSGEFQPVSLEEAQPFYQERATDEEVSTGQALGEGLLRGATGGLPDLMLQPGSGAAQGLQDVEQGAPGTVLGGEIAGTLLPFVGPLKTARLATVPGLLEAGGSALTTAARKGAPGLTRVALSRAAGVGAEVSGALALEETRRAHLEARPANFTRVLGGYGLGAMIPAMVLGTGVGLLEGGAMTLGQRALVRGKKARDIVLQPGVSESDMYDILTREHGVAAPGMLDQFHASKMQSDPRAMALLNDTGPAGEFYRARVMGADQSRLQSAEKLAGLMNTVRDIDDMHAAGWMGRQKRELVEKLMVGETQADSFALREALKDPAAHGEIANTIAQQVKSKTEFGKKLMDELGLGKGMDVRTSILRALEGADEATLRMVASPEFSTVMGRGGNPKWKAASEAASSNPMWRSEPNKLLADLEEGAQLMELEGKGYVGEQAGKLKHIQELAQGVRGKLAQTDRAGAMIEMDFLKKRLGDWAKPDQYLGAGDAVAAYARQQYETVKELLENPMYWGERAAAAQHETNAIFAKRLARSDSFYKGWFKDAGVPDPKNPWRNQMEATPDSVMNILGDVTDVNHPGAAKWREHIAETRNVIDNQLKNFEHLSPAEIAQLNSAKPLIDDAENAFNETIHYNLLANQANKLRGANVGWQANLVGRSLVGSVLGGVPGALAGAYLTNKLNPATSIVARAHLERILRQNEARVERAVQRILGNDVPHTSLSQAVTRLADEPREVKQEAYQKSIKELYAAAQDPTKAQEAIQKELGAMEEHMPGITAQAAQQAVAGMRYAYDHAPAKPVTTLVDGEFISPVSDVELHVWELLSEAAMDPTSILEHAEAGELIPEAIDAAEAVAPDFVAELRMEVGDAIAGGELSYEQVVTLSTLFKMPVDMTTTPEYIQTQQLLYAARAQAKAPQVPRSFGETGVHKTDTMSKADRLESGVPPS